MIGSAKRMIAAMAGAIVGAGLVAFVEARAARASAPTESYASLVAADFGVLAPLAVVLGIAFSCAHMLVEPGDALTPGAHLQALRTAPIMTRTRTAAAIPLAILAAFGVMVALANVARARLAVGAPAESGALTSVAFAGLVLAGASTAFALFLPLRRALAKGFERRTWLLDPAMTGGLALVVTGACFVAGVRAGDVGGDGAWPLGVFGVLKRDELDLRPVLDVGAIAACAYVATVIASSLALRVSLLAALVTLPLGAWSTFHAATGLEHARNVSRGLERGAPLGRVALTALRRASDRDRDGASALFGGGDCDDSDPNRSPFLLDKPGNRIDEDCSGADTPLPEPVVVAPVVRAPELPPDLNVLLITVDTLRPDVGFMGYDQPTTPNLDALAAKGAVFDHAYSLASYTGKSIGPMLIGKYPSETDRDGGHFNTYGPGDQMVAQRLHAAHVRTFGAASHWYFHAWSGLSRGMDEWDMTAKPSEGQGDNDTSVTSKELSDAALRLLAKPENTDARFFMWLHYFDPHEQYMPHAGAPDFHKEGEVATRAMYDGEVWYTDQHIGRVLDYVASQPWGARTAIIVTSDHGEAFSEHNMSWHGVELWESLIHVPLLVYVPGQEPRHVEPKRSHIDLVPTILELMHVDDGTVFEGRSLVSDVLGTAPPEERDVLVDMPAGPYTLMHKALITGKTPGKKLIWFGGKSYQLFDLATDPDELHDLSGDEAQMTPMLEAFDAARGRLKEIDVKPVVP